MCGGRYSNHRVVPFRGIPLARSSIKKQIDELDSVSKDPKHTHLLNHHRAILEIINLDSESLTKATTITLSDVDIESFLEKATAFKKPIISFMEPNMFDYTTILEISKEIIRYLINISPEKKGLELLSKALDRGDVEVREAVKAIFNEDVEWFNHLGGKLNIDPSLLLYIFDSPLRPFFEDLARMVEDEIIETWWEPFCPVCGRRSQVARMRNRKRYMTCTYCGAQYIIDLFLCPNCGNNDPTTQGFVSFENFPEYELSYCEKCKHYVKVIKEDEMKRKIPQGLEDILTRELDAFAKEHELGLVRG